MERVIAQHISRIHSCIFYFPFSRHVQMAALREAIAKHADVELDRVALFRPVERLVSHDFGRHFPHTKQKLIKLADNETSESCRLFFWQHDLVVTIKPSP